MIVSTLSYVCLGTLLVCVLRWCYIQYRRLSCSEKFPKPVDSTFFLGNVNKLNQSDVELFRSFRNFAKEFYPHYSLRLLYVPSVNLLLPEDCEIFMNTKKHSTKSIAYDVLLNWLKEGLLVSKGGKWAKRRKILTPAFHFDILKVFVKVFNEEVQKTLVTISKTCSEPIDVCTLSAEFTLNSICETAMGYKLDKEDEHTKQYLKAIHEIENIFLYRMMRPWFSSQLLYFFSPNYWRESKCLKILHEFTRNVIKERMKTFEGTDRLYTAVEDRDHDKVYMGRKKRRLAMLDVLLQAQKDEGSIDYEGICEEVDTFMFEGHDTTATAISFCLMLIANHPKVQNEIVEEIRTVLNGKTTEPTFEDFQKMEYLDRCIKESLRLYPSVYFISREAEEDTVLHSGLSVAQGTIVNIHIFDIHRNPEVFPSPNEYDPDRFLPENCQNRHPFAYIPFSAGPRNCIGQRFAFLEIKAFLTGVLSNFVLTPIDTPETLDLATNLVLRVKGGIKVKFTPSV